MNILINLFNYAKWWELKRRISLASLTHMMEGSDFVTT